MKIQIRNLSEERFENRVSFFIFLRKEILIKLAKDLKRDDNVKLADTTCQVVRTSENDHGEIIVHLSVPNLTTPGRKKTDHNAIMIVPKEFEFKVVEEHFVT